MWMLNIILKIYTKIWINHKTKIESSWNIEREGKKIVQNQIIHGRQR